MAYLDLDTHEGQEYWLAMNLAGDYASACHEVIHEKITVALGAELLAKVEITTILHGRKRGMVKRLLSIEKVLRQLQKELWGLFQAPWLHQDFWFVEKGSRMRYNRHLMGQVD